jgi:hypothetical protein
MGPKSVATTPLDAAAAAAAPRRITPIACSKGWKRRLYRDCLDRTRRARAQGVPTPDRMAYDLLRQHAIEIQVVPSWRHGENDTNCQSSSSSSRDCLEIQEEAETSRMSIDDNDNDNTPPPHNDDELGVAHYITEEELFELMKEVEDEIEREEMLRHEQIFRLDQLDRHCLQEQVAEFEEWQQQSTMAPPLCPTCYEETILMQQQSSDYSAYASYCCVHCHYMLPSGEASYYHHGERS